MKIRPAVRAFVSSLLFAAGLAQAAGDSGTSSVGEMGVSGSQLGLLVGGVVVLGLVVWVLVKVLAK